VNWTTSYGIQARTTLAHKNPWYFEYLRLISQCISRLRNRETQGLLARECYRAVCSLSTSGLVCRLPQRPRLGRCREPPSLGKENIQITEISLISLFEFEVSTLLHTLR
jgi:hypothetical protein